MEQFQKRDSYGIDISPEHTHKEIVDIAVLLATGEMQLPDYQIKQAKVNLNQKEY